MAWYKVELEFEDGEVKKFTVPAWDAMEATGYASDLLPEIDLDGPRITSVSVKPVG